MPILEQLASAVGGNLTSGIADIIRLFKVDPNLALEKHVELEQIQAGLQGKIIDQVTEQLKVNEVEAASKSIWIAGWRPGAGWTCIAALAYNYIIQPFVQLGLVMFHSNFDPHLLPTLNGGDLFALLSGLLGLGAMRSYDKTSGNGNGH